MQSGIGNLIAIDREAARRNPGCFSFSSKTLVHAYVCKDTAMEVRA
jgi:hypothetical protein